ncbi:substrate-binding domain-containing protein [Chitinibacter sp. S2-10]|uniref:substrate-binding domain-containing protein n=1 Tax=Chitinibacter sp. S2-10 TaxID=3373597 RepID=UPI0039776B57
MSRCQQVVIALFGLGIWCCSVLLQAGSTVWPGKVGVSVSSLENPYFVALVQGVQQKAKQLNPAVKISVTSSDYSVGKQVTQLHGMINAQVDVILLVASEEHALKPVIEKARKQGIIVIGVDVRAEGANQTVLTDNRLAGELVCDYLAKAIKGRGRALIQNGPQVSSVIDRVAGCKAAWARYPAIELLSDRESGDASVWGGHAAMQSAIKNYGAVDAVFAINDRQALGVQKALQKEGMQNTRIGSVDGSQIVVKAIGMGSQIVATASQAPKSMGERAIEAGLALHAGGKSEPELILLTPTLVSKENAAIFKAWDAGLIGQ